MKTNNKGKHRIISIIIPSTGIKKNLVRALRSIQNQSLNSDEIETILCFNPEIPAWIGDESLAESCVVTVSPHKNVNLARNLGIEMATGDFLYFLDDDCELPDSNFLQRVLDHYQANPDIDGCGGPYQSPHKKKAGRFELFYLERANSWLRDMIYAENKALFLLGGNFSVRSTVCEKGIRFDPTIQWGGSELSFFTDSFIMNCKYLFSESLVVTHWQKMGPYRLLKKMRMQAMTHRKFANNGLFLRTSRIQNDQKLLHKLLFTIQQLTYKDPWYRWPIYFSYKAFAVFDQKWIHRWHSRLLSISMIAQSKGKN